MGTVLSFAPDRSQWTASERTRLEALAEQVLGGDGLHVAFGSTDDGAPWCAVTNEDGEVLVHIARVDGRFMVHFVAEDVVAHGADLREAFGQWLGGEPERRGLVVPFNRAGQGADVLVVLAVATFLEQHLRLSASLIADDGGEAATLIHVDAGEDDEPSASPEAPPESAAPDDKPQHRDDDPDIRPASASSTPVRGEPEGEGDPDPKAPVQVVVLPATVAPAEQAAATASTAVPLMLAARIQAGEGDEVLIGGPRAEHLRGGSGDDVLIGGGGRDTLEGGDGDDWIVLTAEAVAKGGAGADTFVISTPEVMGQAETLLGTVLDFSAKEGDRLMTERGVVVVVARNDEADLAQTLTGEKDERHVEVDIDGDGQIDGYVVLSGGTHAVGGEAATPAGGSIGWSDGLG